MKTDVNTFPTRVLEMKESRKCPEIRPQTIGFYLDLSQKIRVDSGKQTTRGNLGENSSEKVNKERKVGMCKLRMKTNVMNKAKYKMNPILDKSTCVGLHDDANTSWSRTSLSRL